MDLLYFEDFPPGDIVEYGDRTVTAEEIVEFAREFDPQPFHLDEAAARGFIGGAARAIGMVPVHEGIIEAHAQTLGAGGGDIFLHQVAARAADVLGDGQQGRDVVAGVGVLRGQERVVEVQFAHGHAVGPRRPFRSHPAAHGRSRVPPDRGPGEELVADRLSAGGGHRRPEQGGGGHAGVVDQPVDHHLGHRGFDGYQVGGQLGQLPGQLLWARQSFGAGVRTDLVLSHPRPGCPRRRSSGIARNDTRH